MRVFGLENRLVQVPSFEKIFVTPYRVPHIKKSTLYFGSKLADFWYSGVFWHEKSPIIFLIFLEIEKVVRRVEDLEKQVLSLKAASNDELRKILEEEEEMNKNQAAARDALEERKKKIMK